MSTDCTTVPEIWKPVVGHEGFYEVSSAGRVRRSFHSRYTRKNPMFKLSPNVLGYVRVVLVKPIMRSLAVHRLVMAAFVGESDLDVNHKNGIKTDNRLENLEYVTAAQNSQHARNVLDVIPIGTQVKSAKLDDAQVREIRILSAKGYSLRKLAKIFGVSIRTISNVINYRWWRHVL